MSRRCKDCGKILNSYNTSNRCYACQAKYRQSLKDKNYRSLAGLSRKIQQSLLPWMERLALIFDECSESNVLNCRGCSNYNQCQRWWDEKVAGYNNSSKKNKMTGSKLELMVSYIKKNILVKHIT